MRDVEEAKRREIIDVSNFENKDKGEMKKNKI
jgi:hypothetical protein